MSVFKKLEDRDIINRVREDSVIPMFGDTPLIQKTADGWAYEKNSSFDDDPLLTSSIYFVESSSFYVTYARESETDYDQYLGWNSIMSTIGAKWDRDNEKYDFYINYEDTNGDEQVQRITETIAISFNPEKYNDAVDFDNFYVVMSGSTDNSYTGKSGDSYDVSTNLVMAPYYLKSSIDDRHPTTREKTSSLSPAYELRTNNTDGFLKYIENIKSIDIDWSVGTTNPIPKGIVYPEVGLILLFPELFENTQVTNAVRSTGDRSLHSLNSIMDIGAYTIEQKEKTVVFTRLYSDEFNIPTNPTAFRKVGDNFRFIEDLDRGKNKSYITKVGFYNDQNECIAIGNLSHSVEKSPITEKSFKVEITY